MEIASDNKHLKVLHLLTSGGLGGIEVLCREIGLCSKDKHIFAFLFGEGVIYDDMIDKRLCVKSYSRYRKYSFTRLKLLCKEIKDVDVIIVHHNDPILESYYLVLRHIFSNKIFISMVHHCYSEQEDYLYYGTIKKKLKDFITFRMFKLSDKVLFVSKAGYQSYKKRYRIEKEKAGIIYNGINQYLISEGEKVEKNTIESPIIIYAGRLEKIKGVDLLIKALSLMDRETYKLIIVGDGSQRDYLEKLAKKTKVQAEFVGYRRDVKSWMEKADIFVYPSRSEVFGLSIVEAMASKCICIANNVGGIPEIINNGQNGFLNIDNSIDGLAQTIYKALNLVYDKKAKEIMITQARKTAKKYSIIKTVKQLEKEVRQIDKR